MEPVRQQRGMTPPRPTRAARTHPSPPERFRTRMRGYRAVWVMVCVLALPVLWVGAVRTRSGQLMDTLAMNAVQGHIPFRSAPARTLEILVSVPALLLIGCVIVVVTLMRHRLGLTFRAALVFAAANVTTQLLKDFLPRPALGIGHTLDNSFPSGHVTVVASVVVIAIAVVPAGVRCLVAYLGAILTTLTGLSVISLGWHRPSDVIGALMVVCFYSLLALPSEWRPSRSRTWTSLLGWLGFLSLVVSTGGFVLVARTVLADPLIFGSGPVTAGTLIAIASWTNPGVYLTLISAGLVAGASALLAFAVDRLAGCSPR